MNPTAWLYLDGIDARPWGGRAAAARTVRAACARAAAHRRERTPAGPRDGRQR